ncbi:MAG: hypothetical protein QXI58_03195, partial [Candidatus Micrarchaeia archaeon]
MALDATVAGRQLRRVYKFNEISSLSEQGQTAEGTPNFIGFVVSVYNKNGQLIGTKDITEVAQQVSCGYVDQDLPLTHMQYEKEGVVKDIDVIAETGEIVRWNERYGMFEIVGAVVKNGNNYSVAMLSNGEAVIEGNLVSTSANLLRNKNQIVDVTNLLSPGASATLPWEKIQEVLANRNLNIFSRQVIVAAVVKSLVPEMNLGIETLANLSVDLCKKIISVLGNPNSTFMQSFNSAIKGLNILQGSAEYQKAIFVAVFTQAVASASPLSTLTNAARFAIEGFIAKKPV